MSISRINECQFNSGFNPLRSPLFQHVLQTYNNFSSLRPEELEYENLLGHMLYRSADGRRFTLSTKINSLGYIITQLWGKGMTAPLQEMVVKAHPDFQKRNAPPNLRVRIKQAILRAAADVTYGVAPSYMQARQLISLRIPLESKGVEVVDNMDDEKLVQEVLGGEKEYVDAVDICDVPVDIPTINIRELMDNKSDKPLTVALGSIKLFVFQKLIA